MDNRLDSELCRIAPTLFFDRYASPKETALCWGFECGDGWSDILKETACKLEPLCRKVYEDALTKERPWYPYIRDFMGVVARSYMAFLWKPLYRVLSKTTNIYGSPIGWYGGPPCRASQVKEKYGTLRFYMTSETEEMSAIIDEAERQSAMTCETCGKPGKLRGNGWYYTRCAKCWKEEQKNA